MSSLIKKINRKLKGNKKSNQANLTPLAEHASGAQQRVQPPSTQDTTGRATRRKLDHSSTPDLHPSMVLGFSGAQTSVQAGNDVNIGSHNQLLVYVQDPDGKRHDVAKWLCGFTSDQKAIYNGLQDLRVEDTGTSILSSLEFESWENGDLALLECTGMPGAGKSMTAAVVIQHFERKFKHDSSSVVLYFFFRYDASKSHSVDMGRVLANLLGQLVSLRADLSASLSALYEEYRSHDPKTAPPTHTILDALKSEIHSAYKSTFIVVDALDEFKTGNDGQDQRLIRTLEGLRAQIMVTSRMHVPFTNRAQAGIRRIYANDEDIVLYVRDRFLQGPWSNVIGSSEDLQREICEGVRENAAGMFLVARLQVDLLQRFRFPVDIRNVQKHLPRGLEDTYKATLQRIADMGDDEKDFADKIFSWILFARQLLPFDELRRALATRSGLVGSIEENLPTKEDVLAVCVGLVVEESYYQGEITLRFVHASTKEFFEKNASIYLPNAQCNITETCLHYLHIQSEVIESCYARQTYAAPYPVRLQSYALMNWGWHAQECCEEFDEELAINIFQNRAVISMLNSLSTRIQNYPFSTLPRLSIYDHVLIYFDLVCTLQKRYPGGIDKLAEIRNPAEQCHLELAAYLGSYRTVVFLLKGRAPLDIPDDHGRTPLALAAAAARCDIVRLLMDRGAAVNHLDNNRNTPLSWATRVKPWFRDSNASLKETVSLLLQGGADPTLVDDMGRAPLSYAAARDTESLKILLECSNALIDAPDTEGRTPISYAAGHENEEGCRALLEAGADIQQVDDSGRTLLSHAAGPTSIRMPGSGRSVDIIRFLLNQGAANVDMPDSQGRTPLSYAAEHGSEESCVALVEAGADIQQVDDSGRTPLSYATANQNHGQAIVGLLLTRDTMNVEKQDGQGRTPLSYAAEQGSEQSCRALVEAGADIQQVDDSGRTPLSYSTGNWFRDPNVFSFLLEQGAANVNMPDSQGRTPLSYAAESMSEENCRALLESGADIHQVDRSGRTPLSYSTENWILGPNIFGFLLKRDASEADKPDSQGRTPLSYAAERGNEENCLALLEAGANIQQVDDSGRTPLSYAAGNLTNAHAIVGFLLNPDTTGVEYRDSQGRTPLSYAAEHGSEESCRALLEAGANIQQMDNSGRALLSYAAVNGSQGHNIIDFLLKQDALEVDWPDSQGRTPLSYATERGTRDICLALLQAGADAQQVDDSGRTLLSYAATNSTHVILTLLLKQGITHVEKPDKQGRTPLSHAAERGVKDSFLVLMKRRPDASDTNERDASGRTLLSYAATNNTYHEYIASYSISRYLIKQGSAMEATDTSGRTPLSYAAERGVDGTVALLLKCGANVDLADASGRTPLSYIVGARRPLGCRQYWPNFFTFQKVILCLLGHGAHVNSISVDNRTTLSFASENREPEWMKLLIQRGANLNIADCHGFTPLHYAISSSHPSPTWLNLRYRETTRSRAHIEAVQILLKHGAAMNVDKISLQSEKKPKGMALRRSRSCPALLKLQPLKPNLRRTRSFESEWVEGNKDLPEWL